MNQTAFYKLTYGLYIISTKLGEKDYGCVVNTLAQVTASPAKMSVAINKEGATAKAIQKSGKFVGTVLTETADMNLIGAFGFRTSEEYDKFGAFDTALDPNGIKYVTEHTAAYFSCDVCQTIDLGSHILFIGEVVEADNLLAEPVMTYAYYHSVIKGKTPPKAPSYQALAPAAEVAKPSQWQCKICGYIYEGDTLPEDYVCPVCGAPASEFERV